MAPHERACFYTEAKTKGEKLAFYFAVQSGGNFDVDFDVVDPRQVVVLKGNGERQGDYVISARQPGEYSLCFSNSMSTFADKVIDFDITAEHETPEAGAKSKLAESVGSIGSGEKKDKLQQTLASLHERASSVLSSLSTLQRNQRSMRTNEHRDLSVVKSTDSRIFWFAVVESGLIIGMAVLQVFVIQTFFSKSVRTRV
ncbi:emp24/gp25L/p24 family/GOLD-domain-containing protein [Entophlyctis helioformis]|nr:emp24/gp25L/p24 family/GOLD-domain-containing protein [Entophlyctis helioformis]